MELQRKSIDDLPGDIFNGKRVFLRVDFNVPVHDGKVMNNLRIREALPTIKRLLELNAKVIVVSHLGRPKGKRSPEFSLKPVYQELQNFLPGVNIYFVEYLEDLIAKSREIKPGEVLFFENIRFYEEEEKNDPEFAKKLAECADIYVNDAFGTAHRANASTEGIARYVKPAVAGYLLKKELGYLSMIMENPDKPFHAIIGGAKISDKILVIENLLKKVDKLYIVGAMAFTFFRSLGYRTGKSLVEEDQISLAKSLLDKNGDKIILPVDVVVTDELDIKKLHVGNLKEVDRENVGDNEIGVDIGSKTIEKFKNELSQAKLVFWNGPAGIFEIEKTARGTMELARFLAELTKKGTKTIIGGGDTGAAIEKENLSDKVTHVSTGGGASLELIEGKTLPGVAILDRL